MTYRIEQKTPALNFFTIHNNIRDLELAKDILKDIIENYNSESTEKGYVDIDNLYGNAYDGGDLHEFRIIDNLDEE